MFITFRSVYTSISVVEKLTSFFILEALGAYPSVPEGSSDRPLAVCDLQKGIL